MSSRMLPAFCSNAVLLKLLQIRAAYPERPCSSTGALGTNLLEVKKWFLDHSLLRRVQTSHCSVWFFMVRHAGFLKSHDSEAFLGL